jgi:hypothetical protein
MTHQLQCQCGSLSGEVSDTHFSMHAVCYCKDCTSYAFHLGAQERVLNALNGTDIVATQSKNVAFTNGVENLACMSLSPNGLLRWYAKCCNTPIANTQRDWRVPYVGLVHACLEKPLEKSFPPVQMHVGTKSAKGKPPSTRRAQMAAVLGFMPKILWARIVGSYKQTPFFLPSGAPMVEVKVLSSAERERARSAAQLSHQHGSER